MKNSALMALALGCAAHAYAVEDPKPLDLGGFVDLYYQYDFGQPRTIAGSSPAAELNLRQFDIRHNRFRLATAWLDVALAPTDRRPLGFYATLMAGETAEILHLLEPGGVDNWKHIGQAYVSYRAAGPVPITVDLGKFWTAIGYEVADQRVAESYSRGINYTFNQPIYHTGLRVSAPVTPKLTLMGMLVQGWNEVEDSNGSKSVHVGAAYAATERLNIALNGYFGREGTKDGPVSGIGFAGFEVDTTLLDLVASYRLDPHTKLGLNVDLGEARGAGKFGGFALYGRKNLGADSAAAVRLEHTEDPEGLRTGLAANYRSLTATYDHQVAENLSLRFELRHDLSNRAAFVSEDGLRKNRTTLTFAQVLRF